MNKFSCAAFTIVTSYASLGLAHDLTVEPTSENLAATTFEYRVDATRRLYDYRAYSQFKTLRGAEAVQAVKDPEHSMFWYRFLTTFRKCEQYDVLQGTSLFDEGSWYLAAWYHQAEMTPVDGDYTAQLMLTEQEQTCGGKLWPDASVYVRWQDPRNPEIAYQGVIQVVADPKAPDVAEVTCGLSENPDDYYRLSCSAATLSFAGADSTLIVNVAGLD